MSKELCFIIEAQDLLLEQVLVDYQGIPIFFLCKGGGQYYIALCTDIEELNYVVAKLSPQEVYNLLHGKIPMRDVFLRQSEYWEIFSGDEICFDIVTKKSIETLDHSVLPERDACFKILTKQMKLFVWQFDAEYFSDERFFISEKDVACSDWNLDLELSSDNFFASMNRFVHLANCQVQRRSISEMPLYGEEMCSVENFKTVFGQPKRSKQACTFQISGTDVSYIANAA